MKDIYADYSGLSKEDLDRIVEDRDLDIYTKIKLMSLAIAKEPVKELGRVKYQGLLHLRDGRLNPYSEKVIALQIRVAEELGLIAPSEEGLKDLPLGSFFFRFRFTLIKPYISRDDDPFYIIDNPLRKDKVFKVPTISAASWKGNLRWTMMKTHLEGQRNSLSNEEFAEERVHHALLFGTEKGMEMEERRAETWAKYLNDLKPEAKGLYQRKVKAHFGKEELPHFRGRLHFYPTFFNLIDLTVINPHDRETKTGKNPIYMECVPPSASGVFSLLYVPYDLIGRGDRNSVEEIKKDFKRLVKAIKNMFLTYGFSAKKSSGFGLADESVQDGLVAAGFKLGDGFESEGELWKFTFTSFERLVGTVNGGSS